MGLIPKQLAMFGLASMMAVLSFSEVEARPLAKQPAQSLPLKAKAPKTDVSDVELPTKEAKSCHRRRGSCDRVRAIDRVPITITRSGKYCVSRDLTYSGTGTAITVTADNVTINFANHSLFLTDPAAVGLAATDVEEFTLLNDKISLNAISNNTSSIAVLLDGVSKAKIDNIYTENTLRGIRILNSQDVTITNTHHKNHVGGDNTVTPPLGGASIDIRTSSGVRIDNSFFEGSSGTNHFSTDAVNISGSNDVIVTNTKYSDIDLSVFIANSSSGILIENLVANFNPEAFFSGLAIGASNDTIETQASDIIVRNATITNLNAIAGWDGVNIGVSAGVIFEDVVIDTNTTIAEDYTPGALHLGCADINGCTGDAELSAANGLFNNVVVSNTNDYGVLIESATDVVFNDLSVTTANLANVYVNSTFGTTINNSYISDGQGVGVEVTDNANGTTLFNNTIAGNVTGILVDANALGTVIDSNRVFLNGDGITNNSNSTVTVYNRACGNFVNNCNGSTGVFPSNAAGDPSVVGENICDCGDPT